MTRAAATGPNGGAVVMRLLVDTGASYTIVPVEAVERIGCDTHHPLDTIRIVAANGIMISPVVKLARFRSLGVELANLPVVAHTLPSGTYVDGLLGMDVLSRLGAVLDVARAVVRVRR